MPRTYRRSDRLSQHRSPSARQLFAALGRADAQRYDAWYELPAGRAVARAEERLLASLLARFPASRSVLEVGSGTGHFARWLTAGGRHVIGADSSSAMVAVARVRDAEPQYVLAAAEALPFADRTFDVVAFITSLEFVDDGAAALREAARVSRCGVLLGVLNLASPLGVWRKVAALARPSPYRRARFRTPWGLVRELRRVLGVQAGAMRVHTTVWPTWVPSRARRLPFGAFIGLAVLLDPNRRGGQSS